MTLNLLGGGDLPPAADSSSYERRFRRLRLDLHDGPMQDVLALAGDVEHFRGQLGPLLPESKRELALGRIDDLMSRLETLHLDMRELARALEPRSLVDSAFAPAIEAEVEAAMDASDINVRIELRGELELHTASQRIAVLRILRESLANVREHSGASAVHVCVASASEGLQLTIEDDGHGFDLEQARERAAGAGRLGLSGMAERVEMLAGNFRIDTRLGGPTRVTVRLPIWRG